VTHILNQKTWPSTPISLQYSQPVFMKKGNKIQLSMALDPFFEDLFWIKEFHISFYLFMLDTIKRTPNTSLIKLTITSSQQISNAP
jgi:hypothetical protein